MSRHRRLHLRLPALAGSRRLPAIGLALVLAVGAALAQAVPPVAAQQLMPRIQLEPDCATPPPDVSEPPLIDITVRGDSFSPNTQLEIWHWDHDVDDPQPAAQPTTDEYGRFEASFSVRLPAPFQTYQVSASPVDQRRSPLAVAPFVVPCPGSVTVTPTCADLPAAGGQLPVDVNGQGWFAYGGLVITFVSFNQELDRVVVSVDNGSFSARLQPPGLRSPPLAEGIYAVVVTPQVIEGPAAQPVSITMFTIPCRAPAISLSPDCGPAGGPPDVYEIDVAGTGFVPLAGGSVPPLTRGPSSPTGYLDIVFDAGGIEQRFVHAGNVAEDGSWGPVRIQPFRRGGTVTVRVSQLVAPGYVLVASETRFTVPCPLVTEPTATIQPDDCGPPAFEGDDPERRYNLTVTGQGFSPGALEIYFDAIGESGYPVEFFPAAAAEDGTFSQPINPLVRPLGRYDVHLRQERVGAEPIVLQLSFDVPCEIRTPTISLACDPLEPEPPDPGDVVLDTSGWFEDGPILLSGPGMPSESVRSDPVGRYTLRLDAGELPDGPLQVVAMQRDVRGTLVAETATAVIPLPCGTPPEPMLRVLPASISPGFVVIVEGTFFDEGETVNLIWDSGLRRGQPIPAQVDAGGTFRVQVLIFHHDFLGPREVTAVGTGDQPLAEPAQLLVVPGRGSPPAFVPAEGVSFEPDTRIVIRR